MEVFNGNNVEIWVIFHCHTSDYRRVSDLGSASEIETLHTMSGGMVWVWWKGQNCAKQTCSTWDLSTPQLSWTDQTVPSGNIKARTKDPRTMKYNYDHRQPSTFIYLQKLALTSETIYILLSIGVMNLPWSSILPRVILRITLPTPRMKAGVAVIPGALGFHIKRRTDSFNVNIGLIAMSWMWRKHKTSYIIPCLYI